MSKTTCSFCHKRGHNIAGCKRFKTIEQRLESNILDEYRLDSFKQMMLLIQKLRADVDFLMTELENVPDFTEVI